MNDLKPSQHTEGDIFMVLSYTLHYPDAGISEISRATGFTEEKVQAIIDLLKSNGVIV